MTALITAKTEGGRLEEQREEIAETLAQLAEDIRALRARLKDGEVEKPSEAVRLMADLRYWLRAARETEAELETIKRKQAGIAGEYGLDLDAARIAIGCRLDSLRACCAEAEIPG
ncbi:hypothetical protein KUH32_16340 [Thalassococcus sp. CAU 1522]|uniref:Uncharacterized protein n=1 Tax=Thalassococcus arenae TaxID=2851652 RepID=A0ABS6NCP9_9RHOB|nr:hypothetical protein [Thalassococcus arenae]MBV2361335.1 hypothetical protein [Thalassococcus arenae]